MASETRQVITKQTPLTLGVVVSMLGVATFAGIAYEKACDAKEDSAENRTSIGQHDDDISDVKAALGRIEGYMRKTAEGKTP